jgi:hypothetical protein
MHRFSTSAAKGVWASRPFTGTSSCEPISFLDGLANPEYTAHGYFGSYPFYEVKNGVCTTRSNLLPDAFQIHDECPAETAVNDAFSCDLAVSQAWEDKNKHVPPAVWACRSGPVHGLGDSHVCNADVEQLDRHVDRLA